MKRLTALWIPIPFDTLRNIGIRGLSVSPVNLHFVWCPKYRRHLLTGKIRKPLEGVIRDVGILQSLAYFLMKKSITTPGMYFLTGRFISLTPTSVTNIIGMTRKIGILVLSS